MHSSQIFVKTLIPPRPYPPYISLELNNLRSPPNLFRYVHTFKNQSLKDIPTNMEELVTRIKELLEFNDIVRSLRHKINIIPNKLKNESVKCVKTWTRQCECVSAQQLRRQQQMLSLYTQLWGERALKELFRHMRQTILRHGKQFMIGAIGISVFDWEKNRIDDDEIMSHSQDFDYIEMLKNYETNKKSDEPMDNWQQYIRRPDLFVWRRQKPNGCYEYKVYGKYDDVTAIDFLKVQVDIDYRKKWDTNAVILDVVETEPDTGSDIIYWEMLWPRLFINRDYVFSRRYLIKEDEKVLFLYNKGIEHPDIPLKKDKYRITDYYSCMVIRPTTTMNAPGIEFSLTYFDNPGVNIPAAITSWVAMAAMPDFLAKLRIAAREYKDYCKKLDKNAKSECDTDLVKTPSTSPSSITNDLVNDGDKQVSYWQYLHPHYYFG